MVVQKLSLLLFLAGIMQGLTLPAEIDHAKCCEKKVQTGPHIPVLPQPNIIVADSSMGEYTMWTQMQECLGYNSTVGGLQFVCRNCFVPTCLDAWQTDYDFSFTVTDLNYHGELGGPRYPNSIASNGPHASFPYLIGGAWGGMGAVWEQGSWYSSDWAVPVDVGTGDLNTHKNIGKQLPDGNILFIGATTDGSLFWSTYTPDLSTRLAGGLLVPPVAYYWGFDINGGIAYVFYYDDSLNIYYKTTTDGVNWSPEQVYNMVWPEPFPSNIIRWMQVAVTEAGNPVLVFDNWHGEDDSLGIYPFRSKVYVSIGSGQPCIEVGNPASDSKNFYPTIAAGGSYVVVLFGQPRSGTGQYTFWDIYYNYSPDNGLTWSTPRNLTSGITDHNNCLWQIAKRLGPAGDGRFFFAFGSSIPNPMLDLYYNIVNYGVPTSCRWYVGYHPVVGIAEHKSEKPERFSLNIRPNPAQNQIIISYALPKSMIIALELYSVDGRLLRTLDKGYRQAGNNTLYINTCGLACGTYFVVLKTRNYQATRRLMVLH